MADSLSCQCGRGRRHRWIEAPELTARVKRGTSGYRCEICGLLKIYGYSGPCGGFWIHLFLGEKLILRGPAFQNTVPKCSDVEWLVGAQEAAQ